ncbi:MAG: hypothetical protein Q9M36_04850 [Sulfurovum sp.]|nr:hypothetical protein [Sulfurovum sp.]
MFNAGLFGSDTNVSCFNPDSNTTFPQFVRFDNQASVNLTTITYPKAIRNAGFRIWYLSSPDGSFIQHNVSSRTDVTNLSTLYQTYYAGSDSYCQTECTTGSGCYPCLRLYYGNPICSRDNFSVRPEAFVATLIDSNQSTDTSRISNKIVSSRTAEEVFVNLSAEYQYRLDINATSYTSDTAVSGYIQTFDASKNASTATMRWASTLADDSACNTTPSPDIVMSLYNGNSINTKDVPNIAQIASLPEVGEYKFVISDENWTEADWNEAYLEHHSINGFDTGTDCVRSNPYAAIDAANGCLISSDHDTLSPKPLPINIVPHRFTLNFNTGAQPSMNKDFVYVNSLDPVNYPYEDISYNIRGVFQAIGYNGGELSNFVDGCYAETTDINFGYTYLSTVADVNLTYAMYDYNSSNPSLPIANSEVTETFTDSPTINTRSQFSFARTSDAYEASMKGAIGIDLALNFNRNENIPSNPSHIQFNDFNISIATRVYETIYVDLDSVHRVFGDMTMDANISFLYAKVKPAKGFYPDIIEPSIITPVSVLVYCDLGFDECQRRGIRTKDGQTSEFDWWKSWNHDNTIAGESDGNIVMSSTPSTALNSTSVSISSRGQDNTILVSRGALPLPATVPITLVTDETLINYTDRWLLYNPDGNNTNLYSVRFIGQSTWAGHGDTGHVVGGQSNIKTNRRVEW